MLVNDDQKSIFIRMSVLNKGNCIYCEGIAAWINKRSLFLQGNVFHRVTFFILSCTLLLTGENRRSRFSIFVTEHNLIVVLSVNNQDRVKILIVKTRVTNEMSSYFGSISNDY